MRGSLRQPLRVVRSSLEDLLAGKAAPLLLLTQHVWSQEQTSPDHAQAKSRGFFILHTQSLVSYPLRLRK